jgi:hypothetical protein
MEERSGEHSQLLPPWTRTFFLPQPGSFNRLEWGSARKSNVLLELSDVWLELQLRRGRGMAFWFQPVESSPELPF